MKGTIEWSFINIFALPWVQSSIHLWVSDKHTDTTLSESSILEVLDDNHVICSHFVDWSDWGIKDKLIGKDSGKYHP